MDTIASPNYPRRDSTRPRHEGEIETYLAGGEMNHLFIVRKPTLSRASVSIRPIRKPFEVPLNSW